MMMMAGVMTHDDITLADVIMAPAVTARMETFWRK
jgi:hypothetical protein